MSSDNQVQTHHALEFTIRTPDKGEERIFLESDCAVIGSGAHCEIRLPAEQADSEHVRIFCHNGRVHARARALKPPPLLNGRPFNIAAVTPSAVLQIGQVEISISLAGAQNAGADAAKTSNPMRAGIVVVGVFVAALLFVVAGRGGGGAVPRPPLEVPELFTRLPAPCPQEAADQAQNLAYDRQLAAEGKKERSPFDVRDGVAAVPLFEIAAACFARAGDQESAGQMMTVAQEMKHQLEMAYRAHQARLMYALDIEDGSTARQEVAVLLAMPEGRDGAYVEWLSSIARRIDMQVAAKKKKKKGLP